MKMNVAKPVIVLAVLFKVKSPGYFHSWDFL